MTKRKIIESENFPPESLDTKNWPLVNVDQLTDEHKEIFYRRKQAVELYLNSEVLIKTIVEKTRIQPKELNNFVRRCLTEDDNGLIYGYRALIPHKKVNGYHRKSLPQLNDTTKMTGAFKLLLETYPTIKDTIDNHYLKRNKYSIEEPVISIKNLHKKFIDSCRKAGIKLNQYPFITKDLGKRSLERYVKKLHSTYFSEASKRHGDQAAQHARSTGIGNKNNPVITRPYQRVQFDGHRIDSAVAITFTTPEGYEVTKTMDRIWLLVIIDEATRAILGHHICLNREYSSTDVLHCVKNAITPKEQPNFTISGLSYSPSGGFPSQIIPECEWGLWDEFLYDNARANLSTIVNDRLSEIVGCFTNAGPVSMPERRGLVERFFGILEENGFHRLPSTTGSNPNDPRRKNAESNAIKYKISEQHIIELADTLIAEYNGTPHSGISNLTPLEALQQRIMKGAIIRKMSEEKRSELAFFTMKAQRVVRGNIVSGQRPYIEYEGVTYRSDLLSRTPGLIGTKLDLFVDVEDLRTVRAFLPDGSEFGILNANGKWSLQKHSLKTRKAINSLKNRKILHFTSFDNPIEIYFRHLEKEAANNKNGSKNKLAQLRREIDDIPTPDVYVSYGDEDTGKNEEIINNNNLVSNKKNLNRRFKKTITY
ncbi:hypothetical protein [Robertmurraya sp. FSL R5-0851]|uniref:hypothetical protein n=1 Tax=Robertmurraya sp. FSL R5-0851 TaxID=2921584 RepID=UPI0030FB38D5